MSSELKVDTISEKTTDNGISVDTFKLKDGITINSATIAGTQTIASGENGMIIGPASVTGTINIAGSLNVV
jgi:hypothetical protein|tara:strand:- start:1004 stop:1216 length:213 start_codon:yes stop_codon:yes gene_type:complete